MMPVPKQPSWTSAAPTQVRRPAPPPPTRRTSGPPNKPPPPVPRTASGAPNKPLPPVPPRRTSGPPNKPLPPVPARKPTWTSANRQEGPRGSRLEIGHNRVSLTAQEGSKLAAVKSSLVGRKAKEMNLHPASWSLTPQQRERPEEENGGGGALSTLETLYDQGLSGVASPILDSAGFAIDFAQGGKNRTFKSVGHDSKSTWGDGSLQSEGVPIAPAILKAKDVVVNTIRYVRDLVQIIKASKDAQALETGSSALVHGEKREMVLKTVDLLKTYLDSAMSILGTFTSLAGTLPIVGAVVGAISSGLSFAVDAAQWYRSQKALDSIRAQKAAAKGSLKNEATILGPQMTLGHMEQRTSGHGRNKQTSEKFKVNMTQGQTVDEDTRKLRAMRLDEKLARIHNADRTGSGGTTYTQGQKDALRHAEDYAITKELSLANKNRRKEAITNVVFQDATAFIAAVMCLDPTGMGGAVGSGINATIGAAYGVKSAISYFRQKARNHGVRGADLNKSDANKRQHRHNLAVMMYDRIRDAADTTVASIDDPNQVTPQQRAAVSDGALEEFDTLNQRVEAMGVAGSFLRSHDAPNLVAIMRQGFYRDSEG